MKEKKYNVTSHQKTLIKILYGARQVVYAMKKQKPL
jgi:hypothetical protein